MKCQTLFSEKNKKNVINLSSAEYAQSGKYLLFPYFFYSESIQIDGPEKTV